MIFFFSVDGAFWNDLIRLPICFVWETPRGVALCITAVVYCDTEVLGKRGSYTDYAAGWTTRNRVFFFFFLAGNISLSCLIRRDELWGPPCILCNGCRDFFFFTGEQAPAA